MGLQDYEPEVALAVRIPAVNPSTPTTVQKIPDASSGANDEAGDIDSTLMGYGFEYVDATRPSKESRADEDEEDGKYSFRNCAFSIITYSCT